MKKHAFLIMAHNQFDLLEMLIKLLDDPRNDIYLHIDQKAEDFDFQKFSNLAQYSPVYFTERNNVTWGGYSQIDTELLLLKASTPKHYDYYHLLSGVDLPIKTNDELHRFFDEHQGTEFIHFCTPEFSAEESTRSRIQYYHFLQEQIGQKKEGLPYFLERASLKLQRALHVNRLKTLNGTPLCGANWFSITHSLAAYVLQNETFIKRHFGSSCCADELFLQTLVANSKFKDRLYLPNNDSNYESCVRYIDWQRGDPYVFRTEDLDALLSSPCLFARKFDLNVDRTICELLYQQLKK